MKCSLCIHGAKELGTGQTAAHRNLQSRAGHMRKGRFTVPWLRVMNMEIKDKACQLSWGVETSQNPWNEHCFLPASFWKKANWEGGQLALPPSLWLGSVRGQISPKTSPMSTHSLGGPLLEGQSQVSSGSIKLSVVTWMRLGKANQADAQWSRVLFKLRQFYTKCMEKKIWV